MAKFERKTREERQEEICQGARQMFLEKGYRNTTMEDIIGATSLSKGGVYKYYNSPKEILMDIMKQGNEIRLVKLRQLEEMLDQQQSLNEVMVTLTMNKIFDETPDKKLYVMFLSELIYDEEIADLYYQIEEESKRSLLAIIGKRAKGKMNQIDHSEYLLLSRLISSLIIGDQLFRTQRIFPEHKDIIENMLRSLFGDLS